MVMVKNNIYAILDFFIATHIVITLPILPKQNVHLLISLFIFASHFHGNSFISFSKVIALLTIERVNLSITHFL